MSERNGSATLRDARRIVVKVGSSLVTDEGRGVDAVAIGHWCRQLAGLAAQGREVIMVSSGAIAEGMKRLGWTTRPSEVHELQAAAAVAHQRRQLPAPLTDGLLVEPTAFVGDQAGAHLDHDATRIAQDGGGEGVRSHTSRKRAWRAWVLRRQLSI